MSINGLALMWVIFIGLGTAASLYYRYADRDEEDRWLFSFAAFLAGIGVAIAATGLWALVAITRYVLLGHI